MGNDYVVLDGVKPGDKVVVSGTQFLIDGVPVIPQEGRVAIVKIHRCRFAIPG